MGAFRLDRVLEFFTSMELLVGLLWTGVAVFAVTLIVLMRTRWGQSRSLRKCLALSLLVHVLLIGYATTVQIVAGYPAEDEPIVHVSFVGGPDRTTHGAEEPTAEEKPWEEFRLDAVPQAQPPQPRPMQPDRPVQPDREIRTQPAALPNDPSLEHIEMSEAQQPEPQSEQVAGPSARSTPGKDAEPIEAPPPQRRDTVRPTIPEIPGTARRPPPAHGPQPPPLRTARGGVPTTLLERLIPPPRLADPPTTPDPASLTAALTDRTSRAGRSEPAEPTDPPADRPPPGTDAAYGQNGDAAHRPSDATQSPAELHRPAGVSDSEAPGTASAQNNVITIPPARRGSRVPGQLPDAYRLRVAPDRSRLAERLGATPATEAAVKAALAWLAENQNPADGRWDASDQGAGQELLVAGRDRQRAGIQADTGMTGLALLAFLAAGHTHQQGQYRENVRRGLQYLLSVQAGDGNLAGGASSYARMYCHAMAAFAISEAYAMTGDGRLRRPVVRAVNYTIAAQEPISGGWRYKPGDPGDTSQCGWQLMVLKSAELAGIPMPVRTYNGMVRYLRSAASGKYGGLSSYRPGERPSRPMTAEALACWQFLGMPRDHPAGNEAGDYLLEELPGRGKPNLYYWYYATLAMYQLRGDHWRRWNESLRTTLVDTQRRSGPMAGSWDPDTVWGGYGGRVYSTAMGALCLEVYYRFLPLYVDAAPAESGS